MVLRHGRHTDESKAPSHYSYRYPQTPCQWSPCSDCHLWRSCRGHGGRVRCARGGRQWTTARRQPVMAGTSTLGASAGWHGWDRLPEHSVILSATLSREQPAVVGASMPWAAESTGSMARGFLAEVNMTFRATQYQPCWIGKCCTQRWAVGCFTFPVKSC